MTGPVTTDFSTMLNMINSNPDKNIVMSGTSFKSVGKIGAFFTTKTNCRKAADAFLTAIMQQYGEAVSVTISADLRALKTSGKPLSARTARDLLTKAEQFKNGLKAINADMANRFIAGSGLKNDTRTLDAAYAEYCRQHGVDPNADPTLKETFGSIVKRIAASESQRVMTFVEMRDLVIECKQVELNNAAALSRFLTQSKREAVQAVAREFRFTPEQTQELDSLIDASMRDLAAQATQQGKALTDQSFAEAFLESIPLHCFLFSHADQLSDQLSAGLKDFIGMASFTPDTRKNALALTPVLENSYLLTYMFCMEHMPQIRAQQPEGPITREAIWKGCYGEELPADLVNATSRQMNDAIYEKNTRRLKEYFENNDRKVFIAQAGLALGLRQDKVLEAINNPADTVITQDDLMLPFPLTLIPNLHSLEQNEQQLAMDITRRGVSNPIEGFEPTITFVAPESGTPDVIKIQDTSRLNDEEKQNFKRGVPGPITQSIVEKARALCSNNDLQLRQIVISLAQTGIMPVRQFSPLVGVAYNEHSPVNIEVRRENNGNISLRYRTPEASPVDADYTFTVGTDGRVSLTNMTIRARQAAE